jgi:hypothetical protein
MAGPGTARVLPAPDSDRLTARAAQAHLRPQLVTASERVRALLVSTDVVGEQRGADAIEGPGVRPVDARRPAAPSAHGAAVGIRAWSPRRRGDVLVIDSRIRRPDGGDAPRHRPQDPPRGAVPVSALLMLSALALWWAVTRQVWPIWLLGLGAFVVAVGSSRRHRASARPRRARRRRRRAAGPPRRRHRLRRARAVAGS